MFLPDRHGYSSRDSSLVACVCRGKLSILFGEPDREQFRQELAALREQLARAIEDVEFADAYVAQDAESAVERAAEQAETQPAAKDRIAGQLERVGCIPIRMPGHGRQRLGVDRQPIYRLSPSG